MEWGMEREREEGVGDGGSDEWGREGVMSGSDEWGMEGVMEEGREGNGRRYVLDCMHEHDYLSLTCMKQFTTIHILYPPGHHPLSAHFSVMF